MALIFKFQVVEVVDEDIIQVYDNTKDDEDGWGVDTNPNRVDRALLFISEYVDEYGTSSFLEQSTNLVSSNKLFGIVSGVGFSNVEKSLFTVKSSGDGQHNFYMAAIEKDSTKVSGSQGDMYYNTDDNLPYYYNGTAWVTIEDALLSTIVALSAFQNIYQLLAKRARRKLAEIIRDLYSVEDGYDKRLAKLKEDYRDRLGLARETFNSGNYSSGRILLDNLKKYRF